MSRSRVRSLPSQTHSAGFTLTEIVLALAVIATAFVAILGLLPAGLDASRQAANSTVVAVILEDLHNRLQGQELKPGEPSFGKAYYDVQGVFIPNEASHEERAKRLYLAEVKIGEWKARPEGTSSLLPVNITLSWPVNPESGEAIGRDNPKTTVTYAASTLTGTDWPFIDAKYKPKIEF